MTEDAFLSALCDNPGDALTWSALADFLDDAGQPERAELLRLMRRPRKPALAPDAASARVRELLAAGVKPVTVEMTNSIGMRFVLVQPGTFLMGSPADEAERGEDETQHKVTLTKPYFLGVHPVTQGQWKAVMGTNPSHFSRTGEGKDSVKELSDADLELLPVEQASWQDAQEFLKKLNATSGEAKNRREYRLPSEAEWEYACRGGHCIQDVEDSHTLPFHFDQPTASLNSTQANFDGNYPYGETEKGPYLERTSKVGKYAPNRLGLYDVFGNVWEWCADCYGDYPDEPVTDPSGPSEGSSRVSRGGGWGSSARFCRSAVRFNYTPGGRGLILGFRVALVPARQEQVQARGKR